MKCKIIILFYLSVSLVVVNAQDACSYQSLQLDNLTPKWEHLIIDTTIIGYSTVTDNCVQDDVFIDGMDQLSGIRDNSSFVQDGYIYSITAILIEVDQVGYLLEKIDVLTGNLQWKSIVDCRLESHHYKAISGRVVDDQLHIYGVRSYNEQNGPFGLESGWQPSYQFHRVFDDQNGKMLWESSPEEGSELTPAVVYSEEIRVKNYYYDDYWENVDLIVWIDSGTVLTRQLIDTMGYQLGELDTIAIGDWNDEWSQDIITDFSTRADKFVVGPGGTYAYVQQFIPTPGDVREPRANITIYDQEFTILYKVDLVPFLNEGFEGIRINKNDEDGISLIVTYENRWEYNYLLLDAELGFVDYFEAIYDGNYIGINTTTNAFYQNNNVYLVSRTFSDDNDTKSYLRFFKNNSEGTLDSLQRFNVENENWAAIVTRMFVLDDGDFLVKLYYGCHNGFQFESAFNSWMRIDASEFDDVVDVHDTYAGFDDIELFPNPTQNIVNVKYTKETSIDKLVITNLYGKELKTLSDLYGIDFEMDVSDLPNGLYALNFLINGEWISKKFIKI